jgi:hypothetical protein
MTDYVLLGLVIAIVIVGVLLLSCWKTDKPRRSRGRRNLYYTGEDPGDMGRKLRSGGMTMYGEAQRARDYNNRADNVAVDMSGYGAYNDVIKYQGLEKSVYDSHNQWIQDMNHITSGASMQSERDDLGDLPVQWIGLRRPNFSDHPGIEPSARQDVSYTKDQMPIYRYTVL